MKIRLYKDEDAAEVARLHRNTIRHVNNQDYSPETIAVWSGKTSAKKFRDSADKCVRFVAVENEKIVGYADHSLEGEFWGLYVHKDYQKKGVGSQLLQKTETSLRDSGFSDITIKSTLTAKEFYQKQGYTFVKNDVHRMGKCDVPICILQKHLR